MHRMVRYYEWLRQSVSSVEGVSIGFPDELWRVIPSHPANEWIRKTTGPADEADIGYYTSRTLLDDVLHAAGAVEYTVEKIEMACERVQAYSAEHGISA